MQLSKNTLGQINTDGITMPSAELFELPEKVLQFGTGVLLRGLCDAFIDEANSKGLFNGRIVVVKSTEAGDSAAFSEQDNLYTICVRAMANGELVKQNIICSSISRVLSAKSQWAQILEFAESPTLKVIISNTTEVGLQLVNENIRSGTPSSYPGKLLACLYRRYTHFGGATEGSVVVIPTELITGNGDKLKSIVTELAAYNQLEQSFMRWVDGQVFFCNSLVDRIVTKDPGEKIISGLQKDLGYEDKLLTMCEDYRLWAIQGNEYVESVLEFTRTGSGAFVKPDIELYKSLKLHLLNGTHTFSASLAFLSGFDTVKQAMEDTEFFRYVHALMLVEIGSSIPYAIPKKEINDFGARVLDRFRNPFLQHQWLNITLQNTMKMRMRNVPVIQQYASLYPEAPARMAIGFAAYLIFMRAVKEESGNYYGMRDGNYYRINDDQASYFYDLWQKSISPDSLVTEVLSNQTLWGVDLSALAVFRDAVSSNLSMMLNEGVRKTMLQHQVEDLSA